MVFQRLVSFFVTSSVGTAYLLSALSGHSISGLVLILTALIVLVAQVSLATALNIFIWPLVSPLKGIPQAPQRPPLQRLFKEPCAWQFESWINSIPNQGLIRYYGILNMERVLVTSPSAVRQILQEQSYTFHKQYAQKTHLERVAGRGLVFREGFHHKHQRRVVAPAFSRKRLIVNFHPVIQEKVRQLLDVMAKDIKATRPFSTQPESQIPGNPFLELDDLIHRAVFDITGGVSYNIDFDCVHHPETFFEPLAHYRKAFEPLPANRLRVYLAFILPTWMVNFLPIKFNWTTAVGIRRFRKIAQRYLAKSIPSLDRKQTVRSIMDELVASKKLSNQELLNQFLMLQAGGIHTTAASMLSAIWFLSQPQHEHVQYRLRLELQKQKELLETPGSQLAVLEKCSYLNAIINEILRLHPPFSWFGRTPIKSVEICGVRLPRGVAISFSPWAMHRDKTLWGDDACEFRPERWLSGDMAQKTSADNLTWLTFGAGPRRCVGEGLARAELQCVLAGLLGRFQFKMVNPDSPPAVTHQVTLAFKDKLRVYVTDLEED